ncbi:T-cell surface antigen CD2 [Folsomia candida]|uniref:T-cell surface antigen CD2 n=1 Tax=Folsomia candida TaxID=158441 RepID=A0A226E5D8_FOLCA|nr:T-cell surface antigen CD2 [Folsomia candida]OXA52294.1 T-cell surface antigen CD2 [Folsomia candida]
MKIRGLVSQQTLTWTALIRIILSHFEHKVPKRKQANSTSISFPIMTISNMSSVSSTLWFFVFTFVAIVHQANGDCEREWDDGEWSYTCDVDDLPVGAIVGIVIGGIVIFIVIPILICFLCACACFRGRRSKGQVQPYVVQAAPQATYPPQQPAYMVNASNQPPPQHPAYVVSASNQPPPPLHHNYGGPQPLPYPVMPQQHAYHQAPPPYPGQYQNNGPPPPTAGWKTVGN